MTTSQDNSVAGEMHTEVVVSNERSSIAAFAAPLIVGLLLAGLLFGYAPVGLDPDGMYRPIKTELARALRSGRLPFWSDRLGLGCPLVAESHVAAFYPPNLLYCSQLDVLTTHRWLMWAHYVALAAATFLLGRELGLSPWAAALASLSFTLCGFMASSAAHEPFYTAMPYLPLAIYAARRYAAGGRLTWQAGLALAIGVQLTIGHFQIQCWTLGLALTAGGFAPCHRPPAASVSRTLCRPDLGTGHRRCPVAAHLRTRPVRTVPARSCRSFCLFTSPGSSGPTRRCLALPRISRIRRCSLLDEPGNHTAGDVLVRRNHTPCSGAYRPGESGRPFRFWKVLIFLALLLACLPKLSPDVFFQVARLPGLGTFRAPGRYRVLACLGLCLLCGAGLDTLSTGKRFYRGLLLTLLVAAAGTAWGVLWSRSPEVRESLLPVARNWGLAVSLVSWTVGLWAIWIVELQTDRAAAPLLSHGRRAGPPFLSAPPYWGWPAPPLSRSPILKRLAAEKDTGLIVGETAGNALFAAGLTPATPYLGIPLPPPSDLLVVFQRPVLSLEDPAILRWPRRYGVSHGVYREGTRSFPGAADFDGDGGPRLQRVSTRPQRQEARGRAMGTGALSRSLSSSASSDEAFGCRQPFRGQAGHERVRRPERGAGCLVLGR